MVEEEGVWWGDFPLDINETTHRCIGLLTLWISRGAQEWRVAHARARADYPSVERESTLPQATDHYTFAMGKSSKSFRLEPRLANHPVVWKPQSPLSVAPGAEVSLFLRIPLWVGFYVDGIESLLCEFPVRRLSETWFGSPMDKGGCAYAADREFFLCSEELPRDTAHATVPLLIRNSSSALLPIERINLPVPFLSLFVGEQGIWTQRVTLERDADDAELALLRLDKGLPKEAVSGKRISGPREQAEKHVVFQAFSRIFR